MHDPTPLPWSDNPNAPSILYWLYFAEKANFAGILICGIFYGIVIVLFYQCMSVLCDPVNHTRENVKWGLVAYTVAAFSFVTIFTATNLYIQSISYIGNREFLGVTGISTSGPLGYQLLTHSKMVSICRNLTFLLNNWLAEGLLLYRCLVLYSMDYRVIAFPCLMYLASLAVGIAFIYHISQPDSSIWDHGAVKFGLPYFTLSVSLNILLTIMVVSRLVLHVVNIRNTMGVPARASGLYQAIKAIVIVLVESSALYSANSLLFIGSWGTKSPIALIFLPILAETQAIASLLVVRRAADRSALANDTVVSRNTVTSNVRSQGRSMDDSGVLPGRHSVSSVSPHEKTPSVLVIGVETTIDVYHDEVRKVLEPSISM